ncbi:MAG: D-alanine--D-alanine ligase family protein [Anaerolineales bacterium]|nr:D-alanine--D-alanine ligase family protein [Anaerolineales bacterium]
MTNPDRLRLALLFGGRSGEHQVSLASARSVLQAIDRDRFDVIEIGITPDGRWFSGQQVHEAFLRGEKGHLDPVTFLPDPQRSGLYKVSAGKSGRQLDLISDVDVVFPLLHGTFGEDGTLQGLLELADIAYVGAGVAASAVGMDKGIFKEVMRANDIPVVDSVVVLRTDLEANPEAALEAAEAVSPYPIFAKPANLGSSVGVTRCRSRSELLEGLLDAARYDRRILVEAGIDAREIEISVLGNENPEASIPGEIVPAADFYSYEAKYHDEASDLLIPAPITAEETNYVRDLAVKAYRAIDGAGLARVDFLLDRQSGKFFLNELNTMPGFTKISMYPKLWEATGLPYRELISRLVELALERREQKRKTEFKFERESNL